MAMPPDEVDGQFAQPPRCLACGGVRFTYLRSGLGHAIYANREREYFLETTVRCDACGALLEGIRSASGADGDLTTQWTIANT
jgi:hypothetical protein